METIVITLICSVIGSTGLWSLLQAAVSNRQKENSIERKALQALLRDRLLQAYRYYLTHKPDEDDKSNFENMYRQYHDLGCNGVLDHIHDEVIKM